MNGQDARTLDHDTVAQVAPVPEKIKATPRQRKKHRRHCGGILRRLPNGRWQAELNEGYRRDRHHASTREDAERWLQAERIRLSTITRALTAEELIDFHRAKEMLPSGVSVTDAARVWVQQNSLPRASATVREVFGEFLESRERMACRDSYIRRVRCEMRKLLELYADRPFPSLRAIELTAVIEGGTAVTVKSRYRTLRALCDFAVRRGAAGANEAEKIEKELGREKDEPPAIVTPAQAHALMKAAQETSPIHVAHFALSLFAGIRAAEISKLHWENVGDMEIKIGADISKTSSQRMIPVLPVLLHYLRPVRQASGRVMPWGRGLRGEQINRVARRAGIQPWERNCMRHSFVSYYLAMTQDTQKTTYAAGHSTPILIKHYRRLAENVTAHAYFSVPGREKQGQIDVPAA